MRGLDFYRIYSAVLRGAMRVRYAHGRAAGGIDGGEPSGRSSSIDQGLLPGIETRPLFYVNYTLPQGADSRRHGRATSMRLRNGCAGGGRRLGGSFVGRARRRGHADTYAPGSRMTAYGKFIVRVEIARCIDPWAARLRADLGVRFTRKPKSGPNACSSGWVAARGEARFRGPDAATCAQAGEEAAGRMRADGG